MYKPVPVPENKTQKILWQSEKQTDPSQKKTPSVNKQELNSHTITFTFGIIPLRKVCTHPHCYIMNTLSYGLSSITAVLQQGWLWHYITYEGWYAIKQRNQTKREEKNLLILTSQRTTERKWKKTKR